MDLDLGTRGPAHQGDSPSSASTDAVTTKYDMHTLETWFKLLDRDSSGSITQRELIVALRGKPRMQEIFMQTGGFSEQQQEGEGPNDDWAGGGVRPSEYKSHLRRQEIYRIKEILADIDEDGNGCMEWPEFVDFFRRAGLLLEYHTREELNRTELCQEAEKAQKEKDEEDANRKDLMRRTAVSSVYQHGVILKELDA